VQFLVTVRKDFGDPYYNVVLENLQEGERERE
jgi:hypothetical protein